MRSFEEIRTLILQVADHDERIRAVLLTGSRANKKLEPDVFQDFDIIFIVNQMGTFTRDHSWISIFGNRIIEQMPDEMELDGKELKKSISFHYLMLFDDGNRIDLTLFPAEKFPGDFRIDSLTEVWLDKDVLFTMIAEAADRDYWIQAPSEKEFLDACNEFWWVSTYVGKGLCRREITYAKEMLENPVRKMFMQIISWYIGCSHDFAVSFGKGGRHMNKYLSPTEYAGILETYSDGQPENIWLSLFEMTRLFGHFAKHVAQSLNFIYDIAEENHTIQYLKNLRNRPE